MHTNKHKYYLNEHTRLHYICNLEKQIYEHIIIMTWLKKIKKRAIYTDYKNIPG